MPGSSEAPIAGEDLDHVLEHTATIWDELRGARLLVTGGTGFFGRWMVETFVAANEEFGLGATLTVLTRRPAAFANSARDIVVRDSVQLLAGDVRSFGAAEPGWSDILHLATETDLTDATSSFDTAVDGTRHVLEVARRYGTRRLLLASSGAVYGPQAHDVDREDETVSSNLDPTAAASGYGEGKRAAEYLCCAAPPPLAVKIARGFAFVGPHLPLDRNFAVGNFIADALLGTRILVTGDGRARRSYLYAADLAIWLWTILVRGAPRRPYNVGSEEDVSVAELAATVARVLSPSSDVVVARQPDPDPAPRYVPSTARARNELGLQEWIGLEDAVRRTGAWHRSRIASVPNA